MHVNNTSRVFTDKEIIERVIAGETGLFELLVRRTNPFIYRIGRSHGFSHQDTEDLMQDAHVDAFLGLPKFEFRSTYKSWISRLMINRCLQLLRRSSQKREQLFEMIAVDRESIHRSEDPMNFTARQEVKDVVERTIATIPENYRIVLTLRELNQFSVHETAEALGISETNVKVRLNRAKAMLRRKLEAEFSPADIFEFNLIHCNGITGRVMERTTAVLPQQHPNETSE